MRSGAGTGRCEVLASRTEVGRGEWESVPEAFRVRAVGSVAYKLALVAAGAADATWTLSPKHEWDVAAGAALVLAAGGAVWTPGGGEPRFNQPKPWLPGLAAANCSVVEPVRRLLAAVAAADSGIDGASR
jgi:myo-inositol-1(or 4)-monophosphatase